MFNVTVKRGTNRINVLSLRHIHLLCGVKLLINIKYYNNCRNFLQISDNCVIIIAFWCKF